ncbi:MAG: sigma-70 family RNA polymerase sigma factor [Planctomycetaceae bacterium]|nr:sigma-70 family RNA polymerase sigma factor [Planctomycetaceae bacterium]
MTISSETRLSLVARLKDPGDGEAWSRFVTEYEPFLMRLFHGRGLQHADACDVAQQVLLVVAERVADWRPDSRPASFRRWLATVARNAAIRRLQQNARLGGVQSVAGLDQMADEDSSSAVTEHFRRQALAWSFEQIRDEFRANTWASFWETAVQGRPIEAVCTQLGVTPGAVYMARSRIMARLREKVCDFDPDQDEPLSMSDFSSPEVPS